MYFTTIPSSTFDLHLPKFGGPSRGDIDGSHVNSGDKLIRGELIVGRVTGAAHEGGFTVFREFDGGDSSEGCTL